MLEYLTIGSDTMSKNPKIETLNGILHIVQLDSYMDKFKSEMAKENKKTIKWLKIGFIPFLISGGVSLIASSMIPFYIGLCYLGGSAIVKMFVDNKHDELVIMKKYGTNTEPLPDDVPDFSFLESEIVTKHEGDFQSDYYKDLLKEEAKRSKMTLVDSQGNVLYSPEKDKKEEYVEIPGYLNKDETMIQVSDEYRVYKVVYNLPDLTITNKEWDILFDVVYHKLEEKCMEEKFYDMMSFLLRYVIAYSLVNDRKSMSFYSFIEQIKRFKLLGLDEEDISDIVLKLNANCKKTKVIKFDFKKMVKNKN